MIFLIEYNRREGKIVTFRQYPDSQRREAADARLEIELDLNRKGVDHEVTLLEANSEADIRRTHSRYFETLREMLASAAQLLTTNCAENVGHAASSR